MDNPQKVAGKVFNMGGGPDNTLSIWKEFGPMIEKHIGKKIPTGQGDWRQGDQPVYISDIRLAEKELGWKPQVSPQAGIAKLYEWVVANKAMLSEMLA